jgi:hypothetical protein
MNPWFFILVVMGANNIFRESPFSLAISFDVVQHVWTTFAGFSHINTTPNTKHEEYGVSASTVLQFSEALTETHPGQYNFVFDNFFTSIALIDKLSSMGHQATGTVRKGHIDKAALESDVALKQKERGTFD